MTEVSREIGKRIRNFRKLRQLTLEELSAMICKSKSTISKYEKGEIVIDIEALYDIADALSVHVEQFLYCRTERTMIAAKNTAQNFFSGSSQFYAYFFDGRINQIIRCVFDVLSETSENTYKIMMYMNFKKYESYQNCETTYWGYMEHFDSLTNIIMTNRDSSLEKASAHILASYLSSDTKWGIFNGISSRPLMPIATKMLFSTVRLNEDNHLANRLKISKEDIRILKMYNMLSIT